MSDIQMHIEVSKSAVCVRNISICVSYLLFVQAAGEEQYQRGDGDQKQALCKVRMELDIEILRVDMRQRLPENKLVR